jgi:hypothetical protein
MKTMWKDTSRKDFVSSTSIGVAALSAQPQQDVTLKASPEVKLVSQPLA